MIFACSDFSLLQTQATVEVEVDIVAVINLRSKVSHIINLSFFFQVVVEATAVAITKEGAPVDMVEAQAVEATVVAVMAEAAVEVGVVAMVAEATTAAAAMVARVCDS